MQSLETKIDKIKDMISRFNTDVRDRPATWGSIEEIEAQFYIIDELDQILLLDHADNRELSWGAFLGFKGGFGSRGASMIIRNNHPDASNDKLYKDLNTLRDEYFRWRNLKLESLMSPEDNGLLEMLMDVVDDQASILTSWFIKHPSSEAMRIYKTRIKQQYSKNPSISLCLASMGDIDVLCWAEKNLTNKENRCLALQLVSASPSGDIHDVVHNAIENKEIDDIYCVLRGFAYSGNSMAVFKQIGLIIETIEATEQLRFEMQVALCGSAHYGKEEAISLRERLHSLLTRSG